MCFLKSVCFSSRAVLSREAHSVPPTSPLPSSGQLALEEQGQQQQEQDWQQPPVVQLSLSSLSGVRDRGTQPGVPGARSSPRTLSIVEEENEEGEREERERKDARERKENGGNGRRGEGPGDPGTLSSVEGEGEDDEETEEEDEDEAAVPTTHLSLRGLSPSGTRALGENPSRHAKQTDFLTRVHALRQQLDQLTRRLPFCPHLLLFLSFFSFSLPAYDCAEAQPGPVSFPGRGVWLPH